MAPSDRPVCSGPPAGATLDLVRGSPTDPHRTRQPTQAPSPSESRRLSIAAIRHRGAGEHVIALPTVAGVRRRSFVVRLFVAVAAGFVAGFGLFYFFSSPKPTLATPHSAPVPLTSAAVRTDLRVGLAPNAGITIAFSSPMNARSVAAALRVTPAAPVDLGWDAGGTVLTVRPVGAWPSDTLHTITIDAGALATNGQPMPTPVRAAFLTRAATTATITPTSRLASRVSVDTAFELS